MKIRSPQKNFKIQIVIQTVNTNTQNVHCFLNKSLGFKNLRMQIF